MFIPCINSFINITHIIQVLIKSLIQINLDRMPKNTKEL